MCARTTPTSPSPKIRPTNFTPSDASNVTSVFDADRLPASSFAEDPQADSTREESAIKATPWNRRESLRPEKSDSDFDHADPGRRPRGCRLSRIERQRDRKS